MTSENDKTELFFTVIDHNGFVVSQHDTYEEALLKCETDSSIEFISQQTIDQYNSDAIDYWNKELSKILRLEQ